MKYLDQWSILQYTTELASLGMYAAKNATLFSGTIDKTQAELETAAKALIEARDALNKYIKAQHKALGL